MSKEYTDKIKRRKLCSNCIGESFLKSHVSNIGKLKRCSNCKTKAKSLTLEELAELIETAFKQHYRRTPVEPTGFDLAMIREFGDDWDREGEPVVDAIMNAADMSEQDASDIQEILEDKFYDYDTAAIGEETEFSSKSYYEEAYISDEVWQEEWKYFEFSLKTESRFFNRSASKLLKSVFHDIPNMQTRNGRTLIIDAGPNTEISTVFRARSFQSREKLKVALARPDKHLGSPPSADSHPGRMNAHGISVFYGANDPMVALAEVRPPVGSTVAIAGFDIIRPIRLLDLSALIEVDPEGSIFDPKFINQLEHSMFLRNLSRRITIPVMPDHENFEYLATQAVADFLSTENDPPLDGLIFPSVQTAQAAHNIVLFQKAARVEAIELPHETKINVSLIQEDDEGTHPDYTVYEQVPPKEKEPPKPDFYDFEEITFPPESDLRPSTLKIDLQSIHIHHVESVQFKTAPFKVSRHRFKNIEPPF